MNEFEVTSFLADSVEASEGKIYALGIGWNKIQVQKFPAKHSRIGLGVLINVPFTETNKEHSIQVSLVDEDGNLFNNIRIQSQFKLGRPPQLDDGESQIVPFAVNFDGLVFEKPTKYRWVIEIDGQIVNGISMKVGA